MNKVKVLFIFGVWVGILPYLGFPFGLKNILFSLTGVGIIFFSYTFIDHKKKHEVEKEVFDNFSENNFNEKVE